MRHIQAAPASRRVFGVPGQVTLHSKELGKTVTTLLRRLHDLGGRVNYVGRWYVIAEIEELLDGECVFRLVEEGGDAPS